MNGARALDALELAAMVAAAKNLRDRVMIVVGANTGYRITELLSLRERDVAYAGRIADSVTVPRRRMKFGRGRRADSVHGRSVVLNRSAKAALAELLAAHRDPAPDRYLFASRKGGNRPILAHQALRQIQAIAITAGIDPRRVSSHSLRKTFAKRIYALTGHDLDAVRFSLGHASVETTRAYLQVEESAVRDAIMAMDFDDADSVPSSSFAAVAFVPPAAPTAVPA